MLSTSNLSAHQAAHYYSKEDYYSQEEGVSPSRWLGQGAQKLNLSGDVETETFQHLLRGQTPEGQNLFSRKVDIDQRRAATDFTFSAPKSVSIAALVQQDERVVKAHHQAVAKALSVLEERYAQTRISTETGRQRIKTGNLITAVFTHGTSREVEPQLHSHCVVLNATQLDDGRWFSFSNEQAIANKKLLGQLYQNELAHLLKQQGYQIEPKAHGQFELKGYDPELLKAFSTRRKQILSLLEEWESEGKKPTASNGKAIQSEMLLREAANLKTRKNKPKVTSAERLLKGWKAFVQLKGFELPGLPGEGVAITPGKTVSAKSNLKPAIQHCGERDAVFRQTHLERFVFEHHLGEQSWEELEGAIATNPELIKIEEERFTTQAAMNLELNTIRLMQQGKGKEAQIAPLFQVEQILTGVPLTQEQQQAIQQTCTTPDQFIAWQGSAGSGKTYALNTLKQITQTQGIEVRGFAPSAEAAHGLGQTLGIETETVAALLVSQRQQPSEIEAFWIVDEAGLLSMKDAHALLTRATVEKARVLLVGDTKQLSAVEAGNPFKSLQAGGITTAHLDETLRQQTQELKTAVQLIAQGKTIEGIEALDNAGCVQEIDNTDLRHKQLAQDYLALSAENRVKTLLLAGTNQERLELTQTLRVAIQEEGNLGQNIFTVIGLQRKNITQTQAQYVTVYQPGDVLVPSQDYKKQGLLKGQQYTVVAVDREQQQLLVETPSGKVMGVEPERCEHKSVYTIQALPIAPGDQLRWTKNDRAAKYRNGQRFTVQQIEPDGTTHIIDTEGQVSQVNLNGRQYVDYAWISTTYSSQGKTAERVLALMDSTTTNRESFYVTVSRAKQHLTLYTANKAALIQQAQNSKAKENTSDYMPLLKMVTNHAQTTKAYGRNPTATGQSIECGIRDRFRDVLTVPEGRDPIVETVEHSISLPDRPVEPARIPAVAQSSGRKLTRDNNRFTILATELKRPVEPLAPTPHTHYHQLWQHYSQGIQASNAVQLDYLVAKQALADGQSQKQIALMLSVGSVMVKQICERQGQKMAVDYVNKTVWAICQTQQIHKQRQQLELD
ncbi:MobF family relaxase [Leptothoe sp. PORK10 BA2]|uniref:MobF family relaxase n=1 Tax=Leptothoe sp. PORK10 BA2 TaxID=3110254 RepID=UPI002B21E9EC|nr:MobF family relaxase [Leptothoe sp. PORK10 BA2]MEA5464725.1 MobF family relaxase [Leptothoe sp. PORK10 BA2]